MMGIRKRPNTFDEAFIGKLVDIVSTTKAPEELIRTTPFDPQSWNGTPREARIFGTIAPRVVVALPFLDHFR